MSVSQELYRARINETIDYINSHLSSPLNLEQLSQVAGFSPFHFHRVFSAVLGETPNSFINRLRVEHAANLLIKSPHLSVTEIALECGFSSSATFARAFKAFFGVAASQYRVSQPPSIVSPPLPEAPLSPLSVKVQMVPEQPVIYVANLEGYSLPKICAAWDRLYHWANARNLITPDTKMIGIGFDDPLITSSERCRYYACLTVSHKINTGPRVGYLELAGGAYAVGRFSCPAEQIWKTYQAMYGDWLSGSGCQLADRPTYELYLQTPETSEDGNFLMEIYLPVEAN
jgi:AraC family transcriptional regulator